MTWRDQCIADLRVQEGCRLVAYWDEEGKCWTVGYGHTGSDVVKGMIISSAQADLYLAADVLEAETELDHHAAWWQSAPDPVRRGLLNMSFNLGWTRLSGFYDMLAAGAISNWRDMGAEALDSEWHKQLPKRAEFVAALFASAATMGDMS